MTYQPKQLYIGKNGQEKLISGIQKLSAAVKSTMGAGGQTVIIESTNHVGGVTITKDGATVAKSIELVDPVENMACTIMKQASEKTATVAGDGTTSSIVLTEAIIEEGIKALACTPNVNKTEVLRLVQQEAKSVIDMIKYIAHPVTKELIKAVATISTNNDEDLGEMISEVYEKVGETGYVHYEKSKTGNTYTEYTEGIKLDVGYNNDFFANSADGDECILSSASSKKIKVLVTDIEITDMVNQLNPKMIDSIIQKGLPFLWIAPTSNSVTNAVVYNVKKNNLSWCIVPPPGFGWKQKELLSDIALSIGAKFISETTGDSLLSLTYEDLGTVEKAVISKSSCVLFRNSTNEDIEEQVYDRVMQLKSALEKSTKSPEKEFLRKRIGHLTGGVGVIYAGGASDIEQKELYDRIEDAVMAVRSAQEEGVIAGGGVALNCIGRTASPSESLSVEQNVARGIISCAITKPCEQILTNCGLSYSNVYRDIELDMVTGYDVKNKQYGNMIEMGIVDPAKVARVALENAVSVATTILSTNAIVTMAREYTME
jgi:chaperonin GroEL